MGEIKHTDLFTTQKIQKYLYSSIDFVLLAPCKNMLKLHLYSKCGIRVQTLSFDLLKSY